ncbi:MAG: hypothetical protein JNJ88_01730 [Planctomycetes bacterium]|nr:hypothetical protein [Planctomycetota bacterium]
MPQPRKTLEEMRAAIEHVSKSGLSLVELSHLPRWCGGEQRRRGPHRLIGSAEFGSHSDRSVISAGAGDGCVTRAGLAACRRERTHGRVLRLLVAPRSRVGGADGLCVIWERFVDRSSAIDARTLAAEGDLPR